MACDRGTSEIRLHAGRSLIRIRRDGATSYLPPDVPAGQAASYPPRRLLVRRSRHPYCRDVSPGRLHRPDVLAHGQSLIFALHGLYRAPMTPPFVAVLASAAVVVLLTVGQLLPKIISIVPNLIAVVVAAIAAYIVSDKQELP